MVRLKDLGNTQSNGVVKTSYSLTFHNIYVEVNLYVSEMMQAYMKTKQENLRIIPFNLIIRNYPKLVPDL